MPVRRQPGRLHLLSFMLLPMHLACCEIFEPKEPSHFILPSPRDSLMQHHDRSNLIVAARFLEDVSWLSEHFGNVEHVIMQMDRHSASMPGHHTLANKGREAMAYIQFIVDRYDFLPANIAFVHGHRSSWHMRDIVPVLQRLRWGEHDFANLRYGPTEEVDWDCGPGTAAACNWTGGVIRPGDLDYYADTEPTLANLPMVCSYDMAELWDEVLLEELGPPPQRLTAPCCANFVVSRDRILGRSREFYQRLRDWLLETDLSDYRVSVVFEYLWHILFSEPFEIKPIDRCSLLFCDEELRM